MKKLLFLVLAVALAAGLALSGVMGAGASVPPYQCPTCNDPPTVITVDVSTTVNFNPATPTCTGDADLCAAGVFSYDKTGADASKWKAIFDAGASKLLVTNNAIITVAPVGGKTPGIEIKGTCGLQVDSGARIEIVSANNEHGNIFIHVDGDILINGTVRNEITGTTGMPGDITIASCCGNITVGGTGLVTTFGQDYGGSDINILTCCTCRKGNITINGLVMARAEAHVAPSEDTRPRINVVSFDGTVTINGNSAGPFFDEFLGWGGTRYDIWPGLLSWVDNNAIPGSVKVQALGDITVNGHGTNPTAAVRDSFAAIAVRAGTSTPYGGTVDVRSKQGSIIGKDRAFEVNRNGGTSLIRLWAGQDITLSRPGATADFNPVVDNNFGSGGDKGGTNYIRSYQKGITVGSGAQVTALGNNVGNNGANNFTYCTSYTHPGTVEPAAVESSDCTVLTPPLLFPNCSYFGVPCVCPKGEIKIIKEVVGAVPGSDWEFTSTELGNFTLPAAGGFKDFTGLNPGSYTVTETTKPGYDVTPSNPKTLTITAEEPCAKLEYTFTNTCHATLKVTKVVSGAVPGTDWDFTSDIPGHLAFSLPAAGGSVTIDPVDPGTYYVTEIEKLGYALSETNPQEVVVEACQHPEVIFTNTCHATLKITKVVVGTPPGTDWEFTSDIPGHLAFSLPAAGGSVTFDPVAPGTYQVTEVTKLGYVLSETNPQEVVVGACEHPELTFTNTYGECKWCTKSAVLSQVTQNMGYCCYVPDILVGLWLPKDDPILPEELGSNEPATGSIQLAIDYINDPGWPAVDPTPGDGEIFIGVTAKDCGTGTVTTPAECAGQVGRGPYGSGTENVIITNPYEDVRLNVFGCSVNLTAADDTKPVITIIDSVGKVTVLDIHVYGSDVAGYLVQDNDDLVVVKNSRAIGDVIGYHIVDDDVEITGSPEISGNTTAGVLIEGNNVKLRTNNDIHSNGIGIKIIGDNNETNGNDVGKSGKPNGIGIVVASGKGNLLHGDNVSYNTGDGIVVQGSGTSLANGNFINDEDTQYNGDDGIVVSGNYNTLEKNKQVKFNKGDGIEVSGNYNLLNENVTESNSGNGINVSGNNNTLKKNQSKSNTLAGIKISGNNNILQENTGVEKNKAKGFYITGSQNKLTKNEAKNNTGYEFTIAANNNVGSSGNKANGTAFTILAGGGNFGTP